MRANGRNSYQDCFGTIYTGIVLRFGEQAIFRHPVGTAIRRNRQTFKQLRKEKAANKMDLGIWLGKTSETYEHFVGTSDGIFTARTCRRISSDGQWNLDAVKAVTGAPWNMGAGRLIGRPRHARIQVLPSLPEASFHSHQPESTESATVHQFLLQHLLLHQHHQTQFQQLQGRWMMSNLVFKNGGGTQNARRKCPWKTWILQ